MAFLESNKKNFAELARKKSSLTTSSSSGGSFTSFFKKLNKEKQQ